MLMVVLVLEGNQAELDTGGRDDRLALTGLVVERNRGDILAVVLVYFRDSDCRDRQRVHLGPRA